MKLAGFDLNRLTHKYIRDYAPLVKSEKYGREVPIYDIYEDVLGMLDGDKNDPLIAEHRKKLLGREIVSSAPDEYYHVRFFLDLEGAVTWSEWKSMSLEDKAQLRAVVHLQNMVQLIDRHREITEENKKKLLNGKK